jgi:hypothetical protein
MSACWCWTGASHVRLYTEWPFLGLVGLGTDWESGFAWSAEFSGYFIVGAAIMRMEHGNANGSHDGCFLSERNESIMMYVGNREGHGCRYCIPVLDEIVHLSRMIRYSRMYLRSSL